MTDATGVHGVIYPVRKAVGTTDAGNHVLYVLFLEQSRLVKKQDVGLKSLPCITVFIIRVIFERDRAAVREAHQLVFVVVTYYAEQTRPERFDVVCRKFWVCLTCYGYLYPRIFECEQRCLCSYSPGFTATAGAAIADVLLTRPEKQILLGVRFAEFQNLSRHTRHHPQ